MPFEFGKLLIVSRFDLSWRDHNSNTKSKTLWSQQWLLNHSAIKLTVECAGILSAFHLSSTQPKIVIFTRSNIINQSKLLIVNRLDIVSKYFIAILIVYLRHAEGILSHKIYMKPSMRTEENFCQCKCKGSTQIVTKYMQQNYNNAESTKC